MLKRWLVGLLIRITGLRHYSVLFINGQEACLVNSIIVDLEDEMIYLEHKEGEGGLNYE